jgi:hypothetical protein
MKAIVALVLVLALVGIIAIGIVECKNANGADPSYAPGQTGTNPGQGGTPNGPPGQTGANPGQEKKNPPIIT